MKLEVGMYARTRNGIYKITKIENDCIYDGIILIDVPILKANHRIIDLIEISDYVNGYRVANISKDKNGNIIDIAYAEETNGQLYSIGDIKTVITKEQFSQMEYKVGE